MTKEALLEKLYSVKGLQLELKQLQQVQLAFYNYSCFGGYDFNSAFKQNIQAVSRSIARIKAELKSIENMIDSLEDNLQRDIMHLKFIGFKSWEYVAEKFYFSTATVYRHYNKALNNLCSYC